MHFIFTYVQLRLIRPHRGRTILVHNVFYTHENSPELGEKKICTQIKSPGVNMFEENRIQALNPTAYGVEFMCFPECFTIKKNYLRMFSFLSGPVEIIKRGMILSSIKAM
jgi:hypothetical protein